MQLQQLDTLHSWHENFVANRPKLCGNYAFPQHFQTRKKEKILVFYEMYWVTACFIFQMQFSSKLQDPKMLLSISLSYSLSVNK